VLPSSQRERRVSRLNRTGNNTTGWARRLTALLVTACLVMAMALPVYAEVDLLPDAPDEVELLEDEPGTASGEDTALPEQNAATPVPDAATPEPEQSAGPEQNAPTETPEPTAEPTPTPEPAATATATPVPTVTPTATPEPTEQPQKMYAAKSVDNVQAASEKANGSFVLYFMAPSSWGTLADGQEVWCYARKQSDNATTTFDKKVDGTETGIVDGTKKSVYKITLTAIQGDLKSDCPYGGFYDLRFYVRNDSEKVCHITQSNWLGIEEYKGKCYDGEKGKWTDFVAYDPNNHLSFAGNKMVFENLSGSDLANVTAVFYEKDGDTKEVKTVTIGNVAARKKKKFEIPNVKCSYVQFFANDKQTQLSVVYNFYDQETENAFQYDASDKYCYTYTAENTGSWGTPHGGSEVVYFDSTLSSYAYAGDDGSKKNSMPTTQDGGSGKMYCYFENDQGNYSDIIDMTKISPEAGSSRELWSAPIPEGYTKVRFSGRKVTPSETGKTVAQKYDLTDMQEIRTDLNEPCFFADDGDDKTYWGTDVNRDGYWGEKNDVRDAEAGKDSTVVDITSDYSRGNSKGIKYITSTLYDYYTDYELNGNNRDNYATDPAFSTYRIHVPFRQFDQAVSDYYKNYQNADKIMYPIYTGHFQWAADHCFTNVAEGLKLFGWSASGNKYKSFMAANNSEIDEGDGSGKYEFAFLGIVGNKLDSNGNLLMRESNGTDGTGLVEPHFNEAFLNGENSKNTKLGQVYKNVEFPFTQEQIFKNEPGVNYWWYDAAKTSLYLRKDKTTEAYYLGNGNGDGSTVGTLSDKSKNKDSQNNDTQNGHGFFPFNETVSSVDVRRYNYGYGAKLEIPFTLTEDGTVLDDDNNEQSIKFYFSGDDDVWVFIDGQLVLDIGGAHGKAAGIIDFDQRGTNKNKVTAYVSKVKYNNVTKAEYSAGEKKTIVYTGNDLQGEKYNPTKYYYSNTVDIPNLSTGKHTLTMYYMERGMWESNMAVAFNFPDNNELQVQKIVDTTDVNDWFKSCFDTPDLFAFNIQNQATHYRQPEHDATIDSDVNLIELNTSDYASYEPATKNNKGNIFELTTAPTGEEALHWYGQYQDTNPPSECRSERYGILTLNHAIDISQKRYLTFDIYAKSESGQGVLSLGNLYLELLDKNGKQKGCLDKTCLNGTTYGTVTLANDEWITVKLDLHKLNAVEGFDPTQVTTIRVGDNYPRHIYFKDFVFSAQAKATTKTGFTTKQEDIPVYGSIDAGGLTNAAGAQFTTTKNNDTQVVDKNGQFMLQNGETVTFSDQFRRGSYISLKETLNPNLYDTTWTVFENDEAVQSYGSGNTVKGDTKNLNGQAATESQPGPDDGRTEVYDSRQDIKNDGYTGDKKPDANTIVFRSYKDPDENTSSLTKLKVQFVNKVKTGKLVIKKAAASDEVNLIKGKYTFNVTFTNVGDEGLEQETIEKQVTINMGTTDHCEISGIPIGTRFRIEEVKTSDGSHLQGVSVTGGGVDTQVVGNTYVQGSISGSGTNVTATFTNTKHELINIDFTKTWKNANGDLLEDGLPDKIYIQLQRRKTENDIWQPVKYQDANNSLEYVTVTPTSKGWDYPFANLDKFDVTDQKNYQYRIVEGTVDDEGSFNPAVVTQAGETITIGGKTYVVTANATPKSETNSETGATTTPATATDGTITGGSGKIELTNTLQNPKFGLNIIKKDAEKGKNDKDVPLSGVEFKLEKLKAETTTTEGKPQWVVDTTYKFDNTTNTGSITAKTNDKGEITGVFKNLEPGTYRLTETKAHPGYNLLAQPIVIKFTQDGKCYIDDEEVPKNDESFKPGDNNTYTMHLTVLNRKTPELPHTGADAPSLWLLIGMPLAVAGLLIFTFRYNRKGGRRH
jgi:fibro-slime domain-containing protein/LPXTG-motif cell wall-anchored protein